MRCPSCDWTSVSYILESRLWSCKRCHETWSESVPSSRLSASASPSTPAQAKAASRRVAAPVAKKAAAKPSRKAVKKTSRHR